VTPYASPYVKPLRGSAERRDDAFLQPLAALAALSGREQREADGFIWRESISESHWRAIHSDGYRVVGAPTAACHVGVSLPVLGTDRHPGTMACSLARRHYQRVLPDPP
jgi:hypothetical protein